MRPEIFLYLMIALTALAVALQRIFNLRRARVLRELAMSAGMVFVSADRFQIAERIDGRLPLLGAGGVRVRDLIYRTDPQRRHYFFTCEFARGVVLAQCRLRRVMAFDEPLKPAPDEPIELRLAPENLRLVEQYEKLMASAV